MGTGYGLMEVSGLGGQTGPREILQEEMKTIWNSMDNAGMESGMMETMNIKDGFFVNMIPLIEFI